jgi:hypothetical protein
MSEAFMSFLQFAQDSSIEESVIRIVVYFDPCHQAAASAPPARTRSAFSRAASIVAADRIAAAASLLKFCDPTVGDFKVLWIEGLPALEHLFNLPGPSASSIPLPEHDVWTANVNAKADTYDSIKALLFRIISHERNYYDGVKFLANSRFSFRQTTRDGAESLYITASPCADNRYLSLFEAQAKHQYKEKRAKVLKLFAGVGVTEKMTNFRQYAFFSNRETFNHMSAASSSSSSTHSENENDATPSATTVLGAAVAATGTSSQAALAVASAATAVGITAMVAAELERIDMDEAPATENEEESSSMARAKRFKK